MEKRIYLDNAATTKVRKEVLDEMIPYFSEYYGNASSLYEFANVSEKAINKARTKIAKSINASESEIYFVSGGTEADNWAIKGIAQKYKNKGNHIITTKFEHHAVLHTCKYLEKNGFEVTYLNLDDNGKIDLKELENAITDKTILVSIMFANNEVGTIQDIESIGNICKNKDVVFHTDAVQAFGHVPIDVEKMNINLLSASSHKIYGPKGIGFMYIKKGVRINPIMHGGAQEKKKRAGTENVPAIVGFGKAIEMANAEMEEEINRLSTLRDYLIKEVISNVKYAKLNGSAKDRLPNNVNFSFEFIEGESLLLYLDALGIEASSGSACTSGSLSPSHVLLAIGLPVEIAHGSLRLTLGLETTKEDVEYTAKQIIKVVKRLREMSPMYDDFKNGVTESIIEKEY